MIISGRGAPSLSSSLIRPTDCGQPLGADRFQQVVHGGQFEGFQGAVLIGGDEHDGGRLAAARDDAGDVQAGERGHVDVEEDGVDVLGLEGAQRLGPGGRAVDGADPVIPAEQEGQFLDGGQLVVGDEDVNHASKTNAAGAQRPHQASWPGWDFGTRIVIRVPSPGAVSITRPCSSP